MKEGTKRLVRELVMDEWQQRWDSSGEGRWNYVWWKSVRERQKAV